MIYFLQDVSPLNVEFPKNPTNISLNDLHFTNDAFDQF